MLFTLRCWLGALTTLLHHCRRIVRIKGNGFFLDSLALIFFHSLTGAVTAAVWCRLAAWCLRTLQLKIFMRYFRKTIHPKLLIRVILKNKSLFFLRGTQPICSIAHKK